MSRRGTLRRWVILASILAAVTLAGWGLSRALRPPPPDELGIADYTDTVEVARHAGYDYVRIVSSCTAKDPEAMHRFFEMSAAAPFDAASSEGHSDVAGKLFRRLGDKFFGGCLAKESQTTQASVRDYLLYDLGVTGDGDVDESEVERVFPVTFPKDRNDSWGLLRNRAATADE